MSTWKSRSCFKYFGRGSLDTAVNRLLLLLPAGSSNSLRILFLHKLTRDIIVKECIWLYGKIWWIQGPSLDEHDECFSLASSCLRNLLAPAACKSCTHCWIISLSLSHPACIACSIALIATLNAVIILAPSKLNSVLLASALYNKSNFIRGVPERR